MPGPQAPTTGERCSVCPALRLESALPIALGSNQHALDSISRLYSRLSNPDQLPVDLGDAVNRVTRLENGQPLRIPLVHQLLSEEWPIEEDSDILPVWFITLRAAATIFKKIVGDHQAKLVWCSSSINPPNHAAHSKASDRRSAKAGKTSPLGFEDVVILHSNPNLAVSGKAVLEKAEHEGFVSLSKEFFPQIARLRDDKVKEEAILVSADFGVWIKPSQSLPDSVQKPERNILVVECNRRTLPPRIQEPSNLLERTYNAWLEKYVAQNSLGSYFSPFDRLWEGKPEPDGMNLLFCPVLYVDRGNRLAAGANISLGIVGEVSLDQVHEIMMCLKVLQAGLAATTAGFSQAQGRIRELDRSHQMFLRLQRPLDALTRAFSEAQSEAQEMQSILNAPQVALFASHKHLIDLFTQNSEIKVSNVITLRAKHSWGLDEVSAKDDIANAYAYALCRIFGREAALLGCQGRSAVEATTKQVLAEVHKEGAHEKLLKILAELVVAEKQRTKIPYIDLIDSVGQMSSETADQELERKAKALDEALKPVVFTPFKSFGSNWPTLPFDLIFYGERYSCDFRRDRDLLEINPQITPFPQNAILDFISNFCALPSARSSKREWVAIEYVSSGDGVEIHLRYSGVAAPYQEARSGRATKLHDYLSHVVQFRDDPSRHSGDFLHCFGNLLHRGLGIVSEVDYAKNGDWMLGEKFDRSTTMLVLNKLGTQRYFQISQRVEPEGGTVVLAWRSYPARGATDYTLAATVEVPVQPPLISLTGTCAVVDHNGHFGAGLKKCLQELGLTIGSVEDATILFLHNPRDIDDVISRFVSKGKDRVVVLLSSTGAPHPNGRERLNTAFGKQVQFLDNDENLPIDSDWARKEIRSLLEQSK